ncbi:hypothetical protein CBER1_05048 [Cercospora berteroae]|uniref:Uncharacterized protein n=1 Tax=Cercospora berteroae TaxID=357750 RepID=A0A2S6BRI2_9PEZI|nr:hypothetical protein CBER1_05048 [Cercospora berteroae]
MVQAALLLAYAAISLCSVIRHPLERREITAACQTNKDITTCGVGVGASASTIVAASNSQSTWNETYYPTTLTEFGTLTAATPTTITTTDSSGETVVAIIFAAGAAWLAVPKAGLAPNPPNEPPVTAPPTTTPEPTSSSTSTTSYSTQTPVINYRQAGSQQYIKAVPMLYSDNALVRTKEDKDSVGIDKERGSKLIDSSCRDKAGQVAIPGDPLDQVTSIGAGINLNISITAYPLCANTFDRWTVDGGDCKHFLEEAQNGCERSGGVVRDACLNWQFQPELNPGELKCAGKVEGSIGVERMEAFDAIKEFCGKFHDSISTPSISNKPTFKPRIGNSEMVLAVDYSSAPDCPKEGNEAQYRIDTTACVRYLRRTIDDCNTDSGGNLGKFGGDVTDACGVFSLTPQRNERTGCGGREGSSLPMKRDDALKAINAHCDRDLSLDPAFNPGDQFFQEPPDGASWDLFTEGLDGYVIKMDAQFCDGGQQTGCLPGKRVSTKGDECKRKLTNVVDACGEEGGIQFDNTQNGCVMWSIYGSKGAPS